MMTTRLEARLDSVERKFEELEQRLGVEMNQTRLQLDEIKNMLTMTMKGKGSDEAVGVTSVPVLEEVVSSASKSQPRVISIDDVQISAKKIELPNFNGTDPLSWICRTPPSLTKFSPCEFQVAAVAEEHGDRSEIIKQLKYNLDRAQQSMTKQANKHRSDINFSVGDTVFLKLRPHTSISTRVYSKLSPSYYEPFGILQRIGSVAYRLALLVSSIVHPVFHVSQLIKVAGEHPSHRLLVQWVGKKKDKAVWVTLYRLSRSISYFKPCGEGLLEWGRY